MDFQNVICYIASSNVSEIFKKIFKLKIAHVANIFGNFKDTQSKIIYIIFVHYAFELKLFDSKNVYFTTFSMKRTFWML